MNDGLRVALVGDGPGAARWASALREGSTVVRDPADLAAGIDALVLAPGLSDPFARAKEALLAGVPVLYAAPFLLSPWQAGLLSALSRRQKRLLRFVEPFQYRPGFPFLRRLFEGREPFWHPLYLRMLRLERPGAVSRIDEPAAEELAVCEALLGGEARHVSAVAGRWDELGEVTAVFLTVQYGDGLLVQCTISLAEGTTARQLVAATRDRTVIMDDLDPVAALRIVGAGGQELFGDEQAMVSGGMKLVASPTVDATMMEARRFVAAVADGELSLGNGERWTRVAGLWWAARQSMAFGGPAEVPLAPQRGETEPPPLRVIEGGGKPAQTASRRPSLTVVSG
ncbi:MAG: hypothetical protein Q8S13_13565 [Dehalococcoidia bacterium]|nr:hypothetical protein [Dehalococcoidia bacterium]